MKPRLFIGSSVEGLEVAYAIQSNLQHDVEVTVWDQGIFKLSSPVLMSLVAALENFDFGAFVFSADDVLILRGEHYSVVRDNVVFELGLFLGVLGRDRCFILMPAPASDLRLPTDLIGISAAVYESSRSDDNWQAATGPASHRMRLEIAKRGSRASYESPAAGTVPSSVTSEASVPQTPAAKSGEPVIQDALPQTSRESTLRPPPLYPWLDTFLEGRYQDALTQVDGELLQPASSEVQLQLRESRALILFEISIEAGEQAYLQLATETRTATPLVSLSASFLRANFPVKALDTVEAGLVQFPEDGGLLIAKSKALVALQRLDDAQQVLQNRIASSPAQDETFYAALADLQISHSLHSEALKVLSSGLLLFPFSTQLLERKASILSDQSRYAASVSVYQQLERLRPSEPSYAALKGNSLLELNLFGLALDAYQRADSLAKGGQAWIIANIGNILNNRGFYGYAAEHLRRALALAPEEEYAQDRILLVRRNFATEWRRLEALMAEATKSDATAPPSSAEPPESARQVGTGDLTVEPEARELGTDSPDDSKPKGIASDVSKPAPA